ncbi:hypothetical protein [Pannonibacter sp. SL95]|uniref:hypothetical protein n=1 Tax=Pannonibacter sp. SL95 TaxID=2995153 RepID=UPI002276C612|nr:hypothetical protein [Pannonibacter sp. SL95]MCY1708379.1 hypothetical protein [Pannonibacter sp. SL95]
MTTTKIPEVPEFDEYLVPIRTTDGHSSADEWIDAGVSYDTPVDRAIRQNGKGVFITET